MSFLSWIKRPGPNGFGYGSRAEDVTEGLDLSGKTYLVTGGNSGLGQETARVLGKRGGHIIVAARSQEKAEEALKASDATGSAIACDLSDPASIHSGANAVQKLDRPIDAIICNAGIMALPKREVIHGVEKQLFVNHIGHFIFVTSLLDHLSANGRVVSVSSSAHQMSPTEGVALDDLASEKKYRPWTAYGQSKLANILFAKELSRRFEGSDKKAYSLHPGVINTNLWRYSTGAIATLASTFIPLMSKTTGQGAATQCYLATHPTVEDHSGGYFADCNLAKPDKKGEDEKLAKALWEKSEEIKRSFN